jgi:hypothetical protein
MSTKPLNSTRNASSEDYSKRYPRVLVISHNAFSATLNNGKTYKSLFKDFPQENISQLFFCSHETPDFSFCHDYFLIKDSDVIRSTFLAQSECGKRLVNDNRVAKEVTAKDKPIFNIISRLVKGLGSVSSFARDVLWKTGKWKSKELKEWIKISDPQLVFFVGGNQCFSHELASWVCDEFRLPLVVYFTDDYILMGKKPGLFSNWQLNRVKKQYFQTIRRSSKRFVIGERMAADYSSFFQKDFLPIMNCIDFEESAKPLIKTSTNSKRIIISYIGGLHLDRWKVLVELGKLILAVKAHLKVEVRLEIYSTAIPPGVTLEELNTYPLYFMGALSAKEVKEKMTSSDMLVHVESLDAENRKSTYYSISTKIPEYASSRTCILAYGPSEVASIDLLVTNKLGVVLTDEHTEEEKRHLLISIINDAHMRHQYEERAFQFAKSNFNALVSRNLLKTHLVEISNLK